MLQRQGIHMNQKKLRCLYREEKLQVRKHGGRKRALGTLRPITVPDRPNERLLSAMLRIARWAMGA
jgi:putative transposase